MISVIVAVANNNVIGGNNSLLWHISEDLQMFKRTTSGHPVVMGRKTFASLGRPLPGRTNVVITRNPSSWQAEVAEMGSAASAKNPATSLRVAGSLAEVVAMFPAEEEVFIIGGGEIYAQAMPLADRFYLTRVHASYDGDVHFPAWNPAEWRLTGSERHERGAAFPHPFEFQVYERKR